MLNSLNNLRSGHLDGCDPKLLYPILRWLSGSRKDLHALAEVNDVFFSLPNDIAKGFIYCSLTDGSRFLKYPKAEKKEKDSKAVELKKSLICEFFGWGPMEYERNPNVGMWVDMEEIAECLGCDNSQRKILGLPAIKVGKAKKVEKVVKKPKKTLLDF